MKEEGGGKGSAGVLNLGAFEHDYEASADLFGVVCVWWVSFLMIADRRWLLEQFWRS